MRYKFLAIFVFLFISACEFIRDEPEYQNQAPGQYSQTDPHQVRSFPDSSKWDNRQTQTPGSSHQQDSEQTHSGVGSICNTDADCILVDKDCCGCNSGGESKAIHKSQEARHNSEWKKKCTSPLMYCTAFYRCHQFQAKCRNSQCVVINR